MEAMNTDVGDSAEELAPDAAAASGIDLADGVYASEETLQSSVAFLRNTLAGLGFCTELNLLGAEPSDVVATCNTIYGLLLQHQKDTRFREAIKADLHRMRLDLQAADRERSRLETRLAAKERELGTLANKASWAGHAHKAADEARREEVRATRREADDLAKKLAGSERRCVQMQHEIRRKEKEYERLQERLAHYLADKKKHERTIVEMAGKLTRQLSGAGTSAAAGRPSSSAAGRSAAGEEGLKAVVAAYEARQAELADENRGLKASLAALQAEYKDMLNRQVRQQQADAAGGAPSVAEEAFLARLPAMGEEEMLAELGPRLKALQRRAAGLPPPSGAADGAGSPAEQRLAADLAAAGALVADQGRLLAALVAALRTAGQAREAAAQADAKRLAQHYQAQLAAAEAEITRARQEQAGAAEAEVAALRGEMDALREAVRGRADAEAAAARQEAEAAVAAARQEAEAALAELRSRAEGAQAELRTALTAAQQVAAAAQADAVEQRQRADAAEEEARQAGAAAAAAEQQQAAAAEAQRRFELLRKHYEGLMAKYAPGIGAGVLLERAVARKAGELTELEMAAESNGSIAAVH